SALLMLDLDCFKMINDQLGHVMGDQYLVHIARVLERALRGGDVLTRFGGDEFAIILDNAAPVNAQAVAERICKSVAESQFQHDGKFFDTSVSIGVANIAAKCVPSDLLVM